MVLSAKAQSIIAQGRLEAVNRSNPRLETLPKWVEGFRPHQVEAVKEILEAYQRGVRMVVLDAPTGSGKTLIAETVRRMLGARRTFYSCSTRSLQNQFHGDYPYAQVLMGRSNYPTERFGDRFGSDWSSISAADCHKTVGEDDSCKWCSSVRSCPYEIAKAQALRSDLAILNSFYFLTEANGPGRFSNNDLTILDECDTLESELMRYVGVDISPRRAKSLGITDPEKVTVSSTWGKWFEDAIEKVGWAIDGLRGDNDLRDIRDRKYLVLLRDSLRRISGGVGDGWVYTGKEGRVSFKPVRVDGVARQYLWRHSTRFLIMSASVLAAENLLSELGWEDDFHCVNLASTFSPSHRAISIQPVANMSRKHNEVRKLVGTLREIIGRHRSERMLLHCVSYDLAGVLYGELAGSCKEIGVGCETYTNSNDRTRVLNAFTTKSGVEKQGCVLIAPSLDRGIDLPDEQCRVQLICKIPYPYLGDRQVSARLHSEGGQVWYNMQTVRKVVQMSGRGVRHEGDWCKTYILDSQFQDLWNKARGLFPSWWTDAIEWSR